MYIYLHIHIYVHAYMYILYTCEFIYNIYEIYVYKIYT